MQLVEMAMQQCSMPGHRMRSLHLQCSHLFAQRLVWPAAVCPALASPCSYRLRVT